MKRIIIRLKYFCKEIKSIILRFKINGKCSQTETKKTYVFGAADYGNIGDIAITYAQKEFLKNTLEGYEIIEIPMNEVNELIHKIKREIKNDDIITIIGGGNMTNRYDSFEELRRMVIKNFHRNLIVSFPQTIDFTDDIKGEESLRRTIRIYSSHPKLKIFARENKSFIEMKKIFNKNEVFLVPDIVMSLKDLFQKNTRSGKKIGLCLRNDKEKLIDIDVEQKIIQKYGVDNIEYLSTYIEYDDFKYERRYDIFKELLKEISKTKVFITDRLHGMIFCYLTGTPCIAMDNDNHKISESYKLWLKDCSYIKLIEPDEIKNLSKIIDEMSNIEISDVNLLDKYEKLREVLLEESKNE